MPEEGRLPPKPYGPGTSLESTSSLLDRIRAGDTSARDSLIQRYLPRLTRLARGRLPASLRGMKETQDLVQETFIRSLSHLEEFVDGGEGAFLAYLRRIFLNLVRDEIRSAARRPAQESLGDDLAADGASPLVRAIGHERLERYEAALLRLTEPQRFGVMLRLEMGFTYQEVAAALGIDEANTARMMVVRAVQKLAGWLDE